MEGKYTDTRYVHAKGKIEARVWYTKKIDSGYTREIREETGIRKNKYSININNFKINLYKSIPNFKNYDTINETKRIRIFENFYLPIEVNKKTYIEQRKVNITYGKEELKNILISELEQQFINDGIEKMNVINKILNIYEHNGKIELEMTYEIQTTIGEEKLIQ